VVLRQKLLVNAGLVVKPLKMSQRHELNQVVVASLIFGKQNEVVAAGVLLALFVEAAVGRHVHLTADNGLEAFCLVLNTCVFFLDVVKKFLYAKHAAVVGNGYGSHAVGNGFIHQLRNFGSTVEYGVFGVNVKVDERGIHSL